MAATKSTMKNDGKSAPKHQWRLPVILYIPNILGYTRIFLAMLGLGCAQTSPSTSFCLWIFSGFLDMIDGYLARKLNQCSRLGILVDVISDNILRTATWIAAIISSASHEDDSSNLFERVDIIDEYFYIIDITEKYKKIIPVVGIFIVSLEWITLLSTQLHSITEGGKHWKTERDNDPPFVRMYFSNNFRNPIGILGIYGLFSIGMFIYASFHPIIYQSIPFFSFWKCLAVLGRLISIPVEFRLCYAYLRYVVDTDEKEARLRL